MTELLDPPLAHPALAAADIMAAGLDTLGAASLWSMRDQDLLALRAELATLEARLAAAALGATREIDRRGAATEIGATSTAGWLRGTLHHEPRTAKREVSLAAALDGPLAATGSALRAGGISAAQAQVIRTAMADLPSKLASDVRADAERFLLDQAPHFDPRELANLGRHLLHRIDPDGARALEDGEAEQQRTRDFSVGRRHDGVRTPRGRLTPELGALLDAALDALGGPVPVDDGAPDPRTAGQRRHDALATLIRLALHHDEMPTDGGEPVTALVIVPLATLESRLRGDGDETGPQRRADVAAQLEDGTPLSSETARRLACDAGLVAAVLGAAGEPLDVGRLTRTVPRALRRALAARDQGCAFPGCGRPSRWCHAHHVQHWARGGPTELSNLVLLCGHHHVVVHHHGWTVTIAPDGIPVFVPPPWIDPDRTPRPSSSTLWRQAQHNHPLRT